MLAKVTCGFAQERGELGSVRSVETITDERKWSMDAAALSQRRFSIDVDTASSEESIDGIDDTDPETTPEELEKLFGSYDKYKTRSENIFLAIKNERFPTGKTVYLNKIPFEVPCDKIFVLPVKAVVRDCTLTQGTLIFSEGDLTATGWGATSYADGPDAESFADSSGTCAYANNQGSAYANNGGRAYALNDLTRAYAEGEGSKAYGMKIGSSVYVENGAKAYKHVEGVVLDEGVESYDTVVRQDAPDYSEDPGKFKKFSKYVRELNLLARAGDAESAMKLGKMPERILRMVWQRQAKNLQVIFLEFAHNLKHPEAAFKLGQHYENSEWSSDKELGQALEWYRKACIQMEHPHAQAKIDEIEAKLKPIEIPCCVIS